MNNENNINNQTEPVIVPTTTPVVDKFMPVSDINQINQPVMQNSEPITQPVVVPVTEPVQVQPAFQVPTVEPTLAPTPMTEPETTPVVVAPVQEASTEVVTTPVVAPTSEPQLVTDNNTIVNENLKKVEIKDYTPPSKAKVGLLITFFIALVLFIIFLPQISSMLSNSNSGVNYQKEEEITTGKLICVLENSTSDLDKESEFTFDFSDKKVKKSKYVFTARGDSTSEDSLNELAEKCNTLKSETEDLNGFYIRCDYSDGKLVETQSFELETLDVEKLTASFTEAGGMLPTYKYDQNIDDIEKNMKTTGYTCERQK